MDDFGNPLTQSEKFMKAASAIMKVARGEEENALWTRHTQSSCESFLAFAAAVVCKQIAPFWELRAYTPVFSRVAFSRSVFVACYSKSSFYFFFDLRDMLVITVMIVCVCFRIVVSAMHSYNWDNEKQLVYIVFADEA